MSGAEHYFRIVRADGATIVAVATPEAACAPFFDLRHEMQVVAVSHWCRTEADRCLGKPLTPCNGLSIEVDGHGNAYLATIGETE